MSRKVNISNNIPASSAYGVYISQLIRYAKPCVQYSDFLVRGQLLLQKLLSQGYVKPRLESSRKFYGRLHDLIDHYGDIGFTNDHRYVCVTIQHSP